MGQQRIVVHLVPTPRRSDSTTVRIAAGAVFGVLVLLLAAFARVATGGQDPRTLVIGLVLALITIGLVVAYGYLRFYNATVFVVGDKVGVTNAIRLRTQVPINRVVRLRK